MRYPVWTDNDRALLRRLWDEGSALKVISHELGRSYKSIKAQRLVMGLKPRRQPLVEGARRDVELRTYLSKKAASRLGSLAMQRGQSTSSYIRNLIMRDLGL